MDIKVNKSILHGAVTVPGSKSHTIRALLLAAMAHGISYIRNPLLSADCISALNAIPLINAKILKKDTDCWTIKGAGDSLCLPQDVVNVGNSGSLLYFLSPIAATFAGWSVFTGDSSIRHRPIGHVISLLKGLGANAFVTKDGNNTPPLLIHGPIHATKVTTQGTLSQYISGAMMAATRLEGKTELFLTEPKETPYLTMTQKWLESLGVAVGVSSDYKHIWVQGPVRFEGFDRVIPCDWEAVAFPLIAAIMTGSSIQIDNVDSSGTQGDSAIVEVLQSVNAPLVWDKEKSVLYCNATEQTTLTTKHLPDGELRVNLSSFPDAICAMAVIACFIEGKVILEDLSICRKKETDRVKVMSEELCKLGANIEVIGDSMIIRGSANAKSTLKPMTINTYEDHRVAMSFACLALALKDTSRDFIIKDAQCCSVSFPNFFECMEGLGADFVQV